MTHGAIQQKHRHTHAQTSKHTHTHTLAHTHTQTHLAPLSRTRAAEFSDALLTWVLLYVYFASAGGSSPLQIVF